jgi:fructokinase
VRWLKNQAGGRLDRVGVGSFGPLDLKTGTITSTPKAAWRNCELASMLRKALDTDVYMDTDVNASMLAEAKWGAAKGITEALYITVGTGIGGGALIGGKLLHGLTHPEMGHIRIPHDWKEDPFAGRCPYHGDCLEGLAAAPALEARWGNPPSTLPDDHAAWSLEARYLALGIANFICTLSPQRIVLGGGVMKRAHLYDVIRSETGPLLNGYTGKLPDIVPPALGQFSGVLGAIALALQKG